MVISTRILITVVVFGLMVSVASMQSYFGPIYMRDNAEIDMRGNSILAPDVTGMWNWLVYKEDGYTKVADETGDIVFMETTSATHDTEAIQYALDRVTQNERQIELKGDFSINNVLTIDINYTSVHGGVITQTADYPVFHIVGTAAAPLYWCWLDDIDMSTAYDASDDAFTVEAEYTTLLFFTNCVIQDNDAGVTHCRALDLEYCVWTYLTNCELTTWTRLYGSSDSYFENVAFSTAGSPGVQLYAGMNHRFTNCHVIANDEGYPGVLLTEGTYGNAFVNCDFDGGFGDTGIQMLIEDNSSGNVVSSSLFINSGQQGIWIQNSSLNTISDCYFAEGNHLENYYDDVLISGSLSLNNTVSDCAHKISTARGIIALSVRESTWGTPADGTPDYTNVLYDRVYSPWTNQYHAAVSGAHSQVVT